MKSLAWAALLLAIACVYAKTDDDNIGYFWHITDIHYQPTYKVGSSQFKRCQSGKGRVGKFGEMTDCDTPAETIRSTFEYMLSINDKPDFVLYTGDMTPHYPQGDSGLPKEDIIGYEHNVTVLLNKYFPDTPSYPIFGNHDTFPRFTCYQEEGYWLFKDLAEEWKQFYSEQALSTIAKGGYFAEEIIPGLLLVSINTNLYYFENKADNTTVVDPIGQFAWVNATLTAARENGKKVLIAYHVPIGCTGRFLGQLHNQRNNQIVEVLSPFHDIIVGHLAGHNHIDAFHIIEGKSGASPEFLAPSVNEFALTNPRVRLIKYQKHPFKLLDYTNYVMDLMKSNKQGVPLWSKEYTLTELYGIPDMSVDSMLTLWEKIRDDENVFKTYMEYWKGTHFVGTACSFLSACHKQTVCAIRHALKDDVKKCIKQMSEKH